MEWECRLPFEYAECIASILDWEQTLPLPGLLTREWRSIARYSHPELQLLRFGSQHLFRFQTVLFQLSPHAVLQIRI